MWKRSKSASSVLFPALWRFPAGPAPRKSPLIHFVSGPGHGQSRSSATLFRSSVLRARQLAFGRDESSNQRNRAAVGGNGGSADRLRRFGDHWQQSAFGFLQKRKALLDRPIDRNYVAQAHLLGREQTRQRMDQVALDGAFEVTRTV